VVLGLKLLRSIVLWHGHSWHQRSATWTPVSCDGQLTANMVLSPVFQVKVHGRVQVNVCDIQELCVEDAGPTGGSDAEGRGRAGRRQVQPLHRLPRQLAESHADHPLHLGGHFGAHRWQRDVHQISIGQKFVLLGMVRLVVVVVVMVVVVGAAVPFAVSVSFIFQPPVLASHFKKSRLPSTADWTSQQILQVALSDVIGRVAVRQLGGGQVLVVSVKPRDEEAGTPWGHSNVRHNFGYRGPLPLFSGVSWHLLKRKRRGGRVTAGTGIPNQTNALYTFNQPACAVYISYLHSLWAHPKARPSVDFWSVAGIVIREWLFLSVEQCFKNLNCNPIIWKNFTWKICQFSSGLQRLPECFSHTNLCWRQISLLVEIQRRHFL